MKKIVPFVIIIGLCLGCGKSKLEEKYSSIEAQKEKVLKAIDGLLADSSSIETRPRNVLLTGIPEHRLVPIYKVNYHRRTQKPFTGSNNFHKNYWSYGTREDNSWHGNFMPGFSAVYGHNFVNISHYNNQNQTEQKFFELPVLIKTLYYPSFSKDTLNSQPVLRNYYMVTAYDDDTNKDGVINFKDLRRMYHFDLDLSAKTALIPSNYSVMSSEYDPTNDLMYIFARLDENGNGLMENEEATHVFWINLSDPQKRGMQYQGK